MLDFLSPELFEGLIWAVILIGGALAVLRLVRDLTGPPRWPEEAESSGPPGPEHQPPAEEENGNAD